jgi:zinc/manganese transport system substrate-binding protein
MNFAHRRTCPLARGGPRASALAVVIVIGALAAIAPAARVSASVSRGAGTSAAQVSRARVVDAIGAENQYADVIRQIGGSFVSVSSILKNPNTDPHTFESSPSVARAISAAQLIVQNGLGYDTFMNKIEAASPNSSRQVITAQTLLDLPNDTANPHLWYGPDTMPAVALAVATDLAKFDPSEAVYFEANLKTFDASLAPWRSAIVGFSARYAGAAVATTEPVADYLLQVLGANNRTPFGTQADIMNGVDPSPQDITAQDTLFSKHEVKAFIYNEQVVDSLTASFVSAAERAGIPIVGVYETMPTPGYDYQSWMLAEVHAIEKALANKTSTVKL